MFLPPFQKITQIGSYQIKDVKISMIEASHGKLEEKGLGDTFLILINVAGWNILHCGDLGVIPDQGILYSIRDVDVLFVPVGGKYTIDAENAKELIEIIKPKYVFPMHYKIGNSKVDIIDTIEPFAALFPEMEEITSPEITITKSETMRVIKMGYEELEA
jgi:L-ascorbate metabolism protein UlaG (beta-lactamase superfamily)